MCELLDIDKTRTTLFRPQSDGQVERFNATLQKILATTSERCHWDWDLMVPHAVMAYRATKHSSTGFTPNMMLFGWEITEPIDLVAGMSPNHTLTKTFPQYVVQMKERLELAHRVARDALGQSVEHAKKHYDKRAARTHYKVGDAVWYIVKGTKRVKNKIRKFLPNYDGPYFILGHLDDLVYRIQRSPRAKVKVVHHDKLKPYHSQQPLENSWVFKDSEVWQPQEVPAPNLEADGAELDLDLSGLFTEGNNSGTDSMPPLDDTVTRKGVKGPGDLLFSLPLELFLIPVPLFDPHKSLYSILTSPSTRSSQVPVLDPHKSLYSILTSPSTRSSQVPVLDPHKSLYSILTSPLLDPHKSLYSILTSPCTRSSQVPLLDPHKSLYSILTSPSTRSSQVPVLDPHKSLYSILTSPSTRSSQVPVLDPHKSLYSILTSPSTRSSQVPVLDPHKSLYLISQVPLFDPHKSLYSILTSPSTQSSQVPLLNPHKSLYSILTSPCTRSSQVPVLDPHKSLYLILTSPSIRSSQVPLLNPHKSLYSILTSPSTQSSQVPLLDPHKSLYSILTSPCTRSSHVPVLDPHISLYSILTIGKAQQLVFKLWRQDEEALGTEDQETAVTAGDESQKFAVVLFPDWRIGHCKVTKPRNPSAFISPMLLFYIQPMRKPRGSRATKLGLKIEQTAHATDLSPKQRLKNHLAFEHMPKKDYSCSFHGFGFEFMRQMFGIRLEQFRKEQAAFRRSADPFHLDAETVPAGFQLEIIELRGSAGMRRELRDMTLPESHRLLFLGTAPCCELVEKERFWSELDEVMESIPTGERVVIGVDFNGHVGEGNTGDEEVMDRFGVKEGNLEGQMVVDFAKKMDMAVVNTYFQKREEHRVTYKSGGRSTQKLRQALGGQVVLSDDWETTAEVIRETGRKVLGVSSGKRKEDKETWWWNEEVQDSIQRKRLAKKKWDMDRTEENRQEYKELQLRVKREVSKAKQKAYDELYTRLDTREREKDLYRDGQRELHCVFVDLEKAYDRVPREELWYCMRKSGVAEKYVRVVQDMYERSRTVVRCVVGQTEEFKVEVGLHQLLLSASVVAMLMDQLSEEVSKTVLTRRGLDSMIPLMVSCGIWHHDFRSRSFNTWKGRELADVMERRKVDILCVQETRWKGSKARSIGAGFKLFYYGVDSKRNGVGVVLKEEFVRNVLEVKRVSDRVMSLKLEIEGVMLNVVSGYAPRVGCELEEKERFWSELDEVMESIPTGERVVIGADFNGHVGEGNTGDEEVMGKFGVKERNLEGQMVVDFAKRMDMGVVNTYFQKREEHRVTYKSGGRSTQVDYILCRRGNLKEISDCKVVVGESVARQHRMVVCRMTLMVCKKKRSEIEKKTKWWKLKKEECCEEFRQKLRQALGGQVVLPDDWETTAEVIRETGRKVLGVSSGRRKEDKETWWWNEEVQDSIQRKRLAKKKWDMDRTEENRQEYKELQRRVKREVSKAKQKAYDELYTRLDTREGEKDLYRLARQRDRDGKDVQQVRVIKDRDGRVLTSEESVQRRWKEYFEELMNEENEREKRVEGVNSVEQKVDKIRKDEVRKALKRMKSGKAVGPDDIPVEVWKCLGEAAVEFLASLFNRVLESERMPEEWRRSVLVPIFKNKGDVQSCSNYRGIKLMSHTMKVWERVVEARLRKVVEICEQQYGFMPRKSTTDAIFALRILMEKYRDGQRELHCVFVDLEKAYDRVPREELWYCMRKSGVAEKYVRVVQDMYERSRTVVRCVVGQTEEFNVEVGLHQGSALSPFLFAIVMDQLSEEVRQESPWTMMFADDIVICSESREQVEENLERWRFALERRGMKVSRSKTEYMCVNEREGSGTVRLQGEEVKKVQEFKYLGSTVQSNGECGKEVKKRVQAGWNGWRKVSGVLCDQKISARIKGKVYRTVVRPAMLYGLETVSLRKRQESELEVAELKMLRFSLGVTRLDRIRNEYIRGTAHVGRLGDKVREARLRWFGHVQRRESEYIGRRMLDMKLPGRRQRGRPKRRHFLQLFRRDPEAFPGQPRDIFSPACPGSSPGPLPGGACPERLSRETFRRHPKQMPEPPQLPPFDVEEQRLYSELLSGDRAPYPISKGLSRHPTEEAHFGRLYPGSYPFGHDPELMTIGESRNVD
ncbi:hypothetical protein QTP86_011082 [Hemibagrus guttatus]|nr:hypothetical protein QTP86_011082 [Hemibagrus guttatus]